jgi:hypothetical protein
LWHVGVNDRNDDDDEKILSLLSFVIFVFILVIFLLLYYCNLRFKDNIGLRFKLPGVGEEILV